MSDLVIPGSLQKLWFSLTEVEQRELLARLEKIVWSSFGQDAQASCSAPRITQSETKRRVDICVTWLQTSQRDLGWSWRKAMDYMALALRSALDGSPWNPEKIQETWAVPGSEREMAADPKDSTFRKTSDDC